MRTRKGTGADVNEELRGKALDMSRTSVVPSRLMKFLEDFEDIVERAVVRQCMEVVTADVILDKLKEIRKEEYDLTGGNDGIERSDDRQLSRIAFDIMHLIHKRMGAVQ